MLQNRVNPLGQLIETQARGAWLGNRGVIHNELEEIVRPYRTKAWITCQLQFRGRHREIMQRDRWTELFFLDEATAFSAGHRPCFQCRYNDHQRFRKGWLLGNPDYGFDGRTPVREIDDLLHAERIAPDSSKVTYITHLPSLPDGTFILHNEKPHLISNGRLYPWHPAGYSAAIPFPHISGVTVLTPGSIVRMFQSGYTPQMGI